MHVINFAGPPCAGKSTAAASLFAEMKKKYMNVELVTEFAKEMQWAQTHHLLADQVFVLANQNHRLFRLQNKVDYVITDAPLFLSCIYKPENYPESLTPFVLDLFNMYDNTVIYLDRSHPYDETGREQNEEESDALGPKIINFMKMHNIQFSRLRSGDDVAKTVLYQLPHIETKR